MFAMALLATTPAWAQPSPAAATRAAGDAKQSARTLGKEGQDALDRGEYAVAAEKFAAADQSFHAPTLVLGQARALVGLGKLVAAQEAYDRVMREGAPPGSTPAFVQAVDAARTEGAALSARLPRVVIDVLGPRAPGVHLVGVPLATPTLGAPRLVDPGTHLVRAAAAGFTPVEQSFTAVERTASRVELRLLPTAGNATAAPAPVAPRRTTSPLKHLGGTALGLGILGLVAGGITGGLAVSKHSQLKDACPGDRCPTNVSSVKDALDAYHTFGTLSTVGFVVGGLLTAGGVTLLALAPSSAPADTRTKASVVPVITLGGVGAVGRF